MCSVKEPKGTGSVGRRLNENEDPASACGRGEAEKTRLAYKEAGRDAATHPPPWSPLSPVHQVKESGRLGS